ncbi:SIR2 family protein [Candidatus Methylobacter oryzae]|uniref:SIR2 family protein n=1 Tax=Candidatus Methylobacter oryzae TaxID=2497749 RepID=A0ABY3C5L6_9GAMM|nr:SIR2 family protein [Candidatus Methylobacter oryzae]TRW89585.1 SIR2 family protein [Candidatus Methylobacter oryzae]
MSDTVFSEILDGLYENSVVPYLGPGALFDATNKLTGAPMPADSNSLILAMNNGVPMAPKLMYEFPRAAMNQELKKGRNFLGQFLTKLYGETEYTRAAVHDWLAEWRPAYVIDINRDTQLQDTYADEEHTLIVGVARITASQYRYKIYHFDGSDYFEISQEQVDKELPILFKPLGTPRPEANYIASDADYVDYITELMGGFAIPEFLKEYRKGKQYLFIGVPLNRDSERMVMSDIIYGAAEKKGWVLNKNPTDKEIRYCKKIGLEILDVDVEELVSTVLV